MQIKALGEQIMMCPLAAISMVWHIVIAVWIIAASLLIVVVLVQKGRGGGLAAAFGGAGGSSLLGTKTGDFLTWVTISLVAIFLILSVVMGLYMRPIQSEELLMSPTQAAATAEQPAPETGQTTTPPAAGTGMAGTSGTAGTPTTNTQPKTQTGSKTTPQPAPANTPAK
jgi:preprotein translocase subunit SecG